MCNLREPSFNLRLKLVAVLVTFLIATIIHQPVYLPIDEEHPTGDCTNPYGKTKFFMEEIFKVSDCVKTTSPLC